MGASAFGVGAVLVAAVGSTVALARRFDDRLTVRLATWTVRSTGALVLVVALATGVKLAYRHLVS